MRRSSAAAAFIIAIAASAAAGCAASPSGADLDELGNTLGGIVVGHESEGPEAGDDAALLVGRLDVADGCVVVAQLDGTTALPSFPLGRTDVDEAGAITWGGSASARIGDDVEIGGGFVSFDTVDARGCTADEAFIVTPLG